MYSFIFNLLTMLANSNPGGALRSQIFAKRPRVASSGINLNRFTKSFPYFEKNFTVEVLNRELR